MKQDGFTLIEVIITIVMASIAALLMLSFLSSGLLKSHDPLDGLTDNLDIYRAIEIVNADYRNRLEQNAEQDIGFYVDSDLSGKISNLTASGVSGQYIAFSAPDANRKVTETAAAGATMYVKVTAAQGNSRIITLLGN